MNRLSKIFTTLKDHKKKSIFGAACLSYLFYYLDKKLKENDIFRDYCERAMVFGDILLPPTTKPRRVTVLLNELAKNGKCRFDFEKFALPLLHLAGLEVTIIKPQDAEQLRNLASVLDRQEADVVYVVGGDGTVSQVINGMMQMIKSPTSSATTGVRSYPPPVGIFPGGCQNVSLKQLLPQVDPNVKWYCENAMALIRGTLSFHGVFEVQLDDNEPFYGYQYCHQGPFQNVEKIKWKYWYWGSLKHNFAYFWTALKQKPETLNGVVQYVEPCGGCSKCCPHSKENPSGGLYNLFRRILGLSQSQKPKRPEYSNVNNPDCGKVVEKDIKTVEVLMNTDKNNNFKSFRVALGPEVLGRRKFFVEGRKRKDTQRSGLDPSDGYVSKTFFAREVILNLDMKSESASAREDVLNPDTKSSDSESASEVMLNPDIQSDRELILNPDVKSESESVGSNPTEPESKDPHFRISVDGDVHEFAKKVKLKVIPDVIQCIVPY